MRSYISKIFLVVYAINHVLTNKGGKTPGVDGVRYERSRSGKTKAGFENVLESWLHSGVLEGSSFYINEYGIPQGGIISPLIANFTLDGLETAAFRGIKKSVTITDSDNNKKVLDLTFGLVRYADDFIIVLNHPRNLELIKKNVEEFLNIRGLQINKKKSKDIYFSFKKTKKEDPSPKFDFLGFTFMYQSNVRLSRIISRKDMTNSKKVIISPSRQNVISFKTILISYDTLFMIFNINKHINL